MAFSFGVIHKIIVAHLEPNFPGIKIYLSGQDKISPISPRISYSPLIENRSKIKGLEKKYKDSPARIEYKDFVYQSVRYDCITNQDTTNQAGQNWKEIIEALVKQFYWFVRSEVFLIQLEALGITLRIDSSPQDSTISKLPFFEARHFFDLTYGYNDIIESAEGTYIEKTEINNEVFPKT